MKRVLCVINGRRVNISEAAFKIAEGSFGAYLVLKSVKPIELIRPPRDLTIPKELVVSEEPVVSEVVIKPAKRKRTKRLKDAKANNE